jgi:hypothetical protein
VTIFSTVPLARNFQKIIYATIGKGFFTYFVFTTIVFGLIVLLYYFIFRLKIKRISQYIWLFICAGAYLYFMVQLRTYPEEAIHLLEFGLLAYFLFRALSHRITDSTVYFTAGLFVLFLFVLFIGTADEFLQWLMPTRFWDYRDVGINTLAGGIFLFGVCKGLRPKTICKPVTKFSLKMLAGTIILNLLFLGFCLANTPDAVMRYTDILTVLSWLQNEEPMTEYGHKIRDPEIGTIYSRFTPDELREIDLDKGSSYGRLVSEEVRSGKEINGLINIYSPSINPFIHEFLLHVNRRNNNYHGHLETNNQYDKNRKAAISFNEHLVVEKYFGTILKHSGLILPVEETRALKKPASLYKGALISSSGKLITIFSLKTVLILIAFTLILVLLCRKIWERRLANRTSPKHP